MSQGLKSTCLIGGGGFIGRPVSELLLKNQRQLTVIDLHEPKNKNADIKYFIGDYGDANFLEQALVDIDEIVLLAYASVPKTSFEDPLADILNNLPAALTLFETALKHNIKKLIVISSGGTVYGRTAELPITETAPTNPISPYGITKLAIEKYALMYHELYNLPVVILRPSNAYGQGQRPYSGQGFIATAIASVIEGKELTIFGEKGTIRDYIHVADIAGAIYDALERGANGECYNIGTKVGLSNRQILDLIDDLAKPHGLKAEVKINPERHFDVPANILDSTKFTNATNWKPTIEIEEGLRQTWDWLYETTIDQRPPTGL